MRQHEWETRKLRTIRISLLCRLQPRSTPEALGLDLVLVKVHILVPIFVRRSRSFTTSVLRLERSFSYNPRMQAASEHHFLSAYSSEQLIRSESAGHGESACCPFARGGIYGPLYVHMCSTTDYPNRTLSSLSPLSVLCAMQHHRSIDFGLPCCLLNLSRPNPRRLRLVAHRV